MSGNIHTFTIHIPRHHKSILLELDTRNGPVKNAVVVRKIADAFECWDRVTGFGKDRVSKNDWDRGIVRKPEWQYDRFISDLERLLTDRWHGHEFLSDMVGKEFGENSIVFLGSISVGPYTCQCCGGDI